MAAKRMVFRSWIMPKCANPTGFPGGWCAIGACVATFLAAVALLSGQGDIAVIFALAAVVFAASVERRSRERSAQTHDE